ncbi:nucleoside hydrolase [Maribacter sp. 2307ULW6-5]|uniref:nucleoside hydrolase n=1 Tax=Maribacter sp. 2307ULW6-5 TaxID=3386275 RepID=UPI0039BC720C
MFLFCILGHGWALAQDLEKTTTERKDKEPVPVIFDTDMAEDYDDVGTVAALYALEKLGELSVLATLSSNAYETTVPTLSVLNTYFGREEVPIGITKKRAPSRPCPQGWAQHIISKYPHRLKSNDQALEAVALYRKVLSVHPDRSITILTVGFLTNLAALLDSAPDAYSPLSGHELVKKKVKQLICMAGRTPRKNASWIEYNIKHDIAAAQSVFAKWDTPIIMSPFEVGREIRTGIPLINNEGINNSPVKDAYRIALTKDKNTVGRQSWDQTVVLVAARGIAPFFNERKVRVRIDDEGNCLMQPGNQVSLLSLKQPPEQIAAIIEELMHYVPIN